MTKPTIMCYEDEQRAILFTEDPNCNLDDITSLLKNEPTKEVQEAMATCKRIVSQYETPRQDLAGLSRQAAERLTELEAEVDQINQLRQSGLKIPQASQDLIVDAEELQKAAKILDKHYTDQIGLLRVALDFNVNTDITKLAAYRTYGGKTLDEMLEQKGLRFLGSIEKKGTRRAYIVRGKIGSAHKVESIDLKEEYMKLTQEAFDVIHKDTEPEEIPTLEEKVDIYIKEKGVIAYRLRNPPYKGTPGKWGEASIALLSAPDVNADQEILTLIEPSDHTMVHKYEDRVYAGSFKVAFATPPKNLPPEEKSEDEFKYSQSPGDAPPSAKVYVEPQQRFRENRGE